MLFFSDKDTLKRLGMMENALQQTTQEAKHLALSYQAKDEEVRLLSQNAQMVLEEKEELVAQLETLEARETERKIEIADMKQKLRASQEALDLERKQNLNLERFKELYLEHEEAFVELNQKLVHEQEARRHMDEV